MNVKELIGKYEYMSHACFRRVDTLEVLKDLRQLDEPEKTLKLKDVIKRIKEFDDGTKFQWTYSILKELGSDFGSKMFHEAYQQGRFDEGIEAHYGRDKVEIPQFVADVIEGAREQSAELEDAFEYARDAAFRGELGEWFMKLENRNTFARAWLDGYEVEKEKRYLVRIIGITNYNSYLNYHKGEDKWTIESRVEIDAIRTEHTRKELEEAGFGEVFNSPLFEVEEVEE